MKKSIAVTLALLLAQPVFAQGKASGQAMMGDMPVSWTTASTKMARGAGVKAPLSLVMFTFSLKVADAGITEAQWANEAARHGVDIATIKMILGPSVYVTKSGTLASCTMIAIEKGYCGKVRTLSLQSRAEAARSILDKSRKCRWVGFDPVLHKHMAMRAGAEAATLWVAADCS